MQCCASSATACGRGIEILDAEVGNVQGMGTALDLSFDDVLYVALAASGHPRRTLVTADQRLSRPPGLGCVVEFVAI